jgi:hypothetical protein
MTLAISYKKAKAICVHAWGEEGYAAHVQAQRLKSIGAAQKVLKAKLSSMSPLEKAEWYSWVRGRSSLEEKFASQLGGLGISYMENVWQTLEVDGLTVPRESDFKIGLEDRRKVVVFCDGEAFHGHTAIFVDPISRALDDSQTAEAFFSLGYTSLRYSGAEIKSGWAVEHLSRVLVRLQNVNKVLRLWSPPKEIWA